MIFNIFLKKYTSVNLVRLLATLLKTGNCFFTNTVKDFFCNLYSGYFCGGRKIRMQKSS